MNRRRYLAGCLLPLATGLTGCQAITGSEANCTDDWTPGIDGDEPTIAPGDETTVSIDVSNTTGLYLGRPSSDTLEFDIAEASVVPSPDQAADSSPPKWYWDSCTGVSVTVPIQASDDAEPGEFYYSVSAIQSRSDDAETEQQQFAIRIGEP